MHWLGQGYLQKCTFRIRGYYEGLIASFIEQGDNKTAWGVTVPNLEGCFSAAGDDEKDILTNMCEAILLGLRKRLKVAQVV